MYQAAGYDSVLLSEHAGSNSLVDLSLDGFLVVGFPSQLILNQLSIVAGFSVCILEPLKKDERRRYKTSYISAHLKSGQYWRHSDIESFKSLDGQLGSGTDWYYDDLSFFVTNVCKIDCKIDYNKYSECHLVRKGQRFPKTVVGCSIVFLIHTADGTLYIGESDNIRQRVKALRKKSNMNKSHILYFIVPNKCIAWLLKTLLLLNIEDKSDYKLESRSGIDHWSFGDICIVV